MTHTSGFTYSWLQRPVGDAIGKTDVMSLFTTGTPDDFVGIPLAFESGTRFRYSGATALLGNVVEHIAQQPLDVFFQQHIFQPLSMTRTGFVIDKADLPAYVAPLVALDVQKDANDTASFTDVMHNWRHGNTASEQYLVKCRGLDKGVSKAVKGDSGLFSTPHDWHKLSVMLMRKGIGECGTRVLEEPIIERMLAASTGPLDSLPFNTHLADLPNTGGPLLIPPRRGVAHSLCGLVTTTNDNFMGASAGSFGWEGIYTTKYWIDPVEELVILYFSNVSPCWRWDLHGRVGPLVYDAITTRRTPDIGRSSSL
eukprot:m.133388 g.133388  ORF g.133388 m.133388 type:complete len:311 (-) comp17540_c0_seq1:2034-2966(-)